MSSGRSPARLAAILSLFGDVADEIIVGVEEPQAVATHAAVGCVVDHVLSFPPTAPADRPIAWLFGACTGKWILNIDDDEVPSPFLIEALPKLIASKDITHAWIARRWLYPTAATYLDEAPWNNEFQLRLVVADDRFIQFSDVFHRPVIANGPGVFVEAPLWHLDTAVNPVLRRRAKADAYERERPGMKIGGRAHNHALYLPELVPKAALAAVPQADAAQIEAVIAGGAAPIRTAIATLSLASAREIDSAWPGGPHRDTLHRGRISATAVPHRMRSGVQDTIDVFVTNESEQTWRWGKDARPEIRLAYRWYAQREPVHEATALRTTFPADLAPGATQFVPLHVVPPTKPGRYELQLELVHEGVCSFAAAIPVEVDVSPREVLAVLGTATSIAELLARLAVSPCLEPVVVLGNDSDRDAYGDYRSVPGLRDPLLAGLEASGRVTRALKLSWRSLSIIRSARCYRRTGATFDMRLAPLFDLLHQSQALTLADTDWPDNAAAGREWWRIVTTVLTCRAIGRPVFYSDEVVPAGVGARIAVFRRLILRYGSPVAEMSFDQAQLAGNAVPAGRQKTEEPAEVLV